MCVVAPRVAIEMFCHWPSEWRQCRRDVRQERQMTRKFRVKNTVTVRAPTYSVDNVRAGVQKTTINLKSAGNTEESRGEVTRRIADASLVWLSVNVVQFVTKM